MLEAMLSGEQSLPRRASFFVLVRVNSLHWRFEVLYDRREKATFCEDCDLSGSCSYLSLWKSETVP